MIATLACSVVLATALLPAGDVPTRFAGKVSDADGQPVRGARVWLVCDGGADSSTIDDATTDEDGRFDLNDRMEAADKPYPRQRCVVARDQKQRLGWAWRIEPDARSTIAVTVQDTANYTGKVTSAAGSPIVGARISPYRFATTAIRDSTVNACSLPPELAQEFAAETDSDGTFVLRNVPKSGSVSALVADGGLGAPEVAWNLTGPIVLALPATGSLAGQVVCDTEPFSSDGVKLRVSRDYDYPRTPVGEFRMWCWLPYQPIGSDGAFRFDHLPAGDYYIGVEVAPQLRFYAEPLGKLEVTSGEVANVRVRLLPAIWIRGRVVDAVTDAGVANVQIQGQAVFDEALTFVDHVRTDEDGSVRVRSKPGRVNVRVGGTPAGYVFPESAVARETVDATEDIEWPTIRLQPAMQLNGIVVDADGVPAACAEILTDGPRGFRAYERARGESNVTGPDGRFSLAPLARNDRITVWARTLTAVTDGGATTGPAEQHGVMTLVVSPNNTARIGGRVVDESGQPIARASVAVWRHNSIGGGMSRVSELEQIATDDGGGFGSGALWPSDRYQVFVEAPGRSRSESPLIDVEAGTTRELAPITLHATAAFVEGRVVDSAGEPIVGATVVNSGDGPKRIEVTTDSRGQFRVESLYAVPIFLCASKSPYRPGGGCVEPGGTGVTIILRMPDESAPDDLARREPRLSLNEQRQLARALLERVWSLSPKSWKSDPAPTLIRAMARIDVGRANEWSAERDHRFDSLVRTTAAEQRLSHDVDEAIGLLADLPPDETFAHVHSWSGRLARTAPENALRLAEEALVRARALEQPHRMRALAQTARLLVRLGKTDAAGKIAYEVAKWAETNGLETVGEYYRGGIVEAIACFDEQRAARIRDALSDEHERLPLIRSVVRGVATHDPARALDIASLIKEPLDRDPAIVELVAGLAKNDFDKAIRATERVTSPMYRAEAFVRIARGVSRRDGKLAGDLVDRAFDALLRGRDEHDPFVTFGGLAVEAAWLAGTATRFGYPDPRSLVYRTLALRPTLDHEHSAANVVERQVGVALVLALVDPDTAATLLRGLEPRAGLIGRGMTTLRKPSWIQAWALADPRHAVELCDKALDSATDQPEFDLWESGLASGLEVLTLALEDRPRQVRASIGSFVLFDEED